MSESGEFEYLLSVTDAIRAREVCENLEADAIEFSIVDRGFPKYGLKAFGDGPPVVLEFSVRPGDIERAKACLRQSLGFFPEREDAGSTDESMSDEQEILSSAIVCDQRTDAEEIVQMLRDERIWSTIRRDDDGQGNVEYSVDVKADDIERSVSIVDLWIRSKRCDSGSHESS